MGGWKTMEKYAFDSASVLSSFRSWYPRMQPHRDIESLAGNVLEYIKADGQSCLLFSSLQSATECVDYATSSRRDNGVDKSPVPSEQISLRAFCAKDCFFAVIFPVEKRSVVAGFWGTPGSGISSRFAEANLGHLHDVKEVDVAESIRKASNFDGPVYKVLRARIMDYLHRAATTLQNPSPNIDDVYFFPTGLAAIYKPHTYMLSHFGGTTVLFGMAFVNTVILFEEFGLNHKFFGRGDDNDMDELEKYLDLEHRRGGRVQTIWAEFPSNPLLTTPNLDRLRQLADTYDIVLAIDDTLGSWSNIDVTGKTDILVTSLTKSFNGYADVIAGSAILNPASKKYPVLKSLFNESYIPELYVGDAEAVERNSRDYLSRTTTLNYNASQLVQYLSTCVSDPSSAVHRVYYPSLNPSGKYYEKVLRLDNPDFTPGYGCVFSVELVDVESAIAFFNALNVHKSPHLGAPFTLAIPYTVVVYGSKLEWAAKYNLRPALIRISAGLEDINSLLADFKMAVEAASQIQTKQSKS